MKSRSAGRVAGNFTHATITEMRFDYRKPGGSGWRIPVDAEESRGIDARKDIENYSSCVCGGAGLADMKFKSAHSWRSRGRVQRPALLTSTGSTVFGARAGGGGGIIAPFISRRCVARCSGYALR